MPHWNIFASELEDILADHGLRLSQLDDRAFIHREKVRRLRKSLTTSKSFPVLNPTEMDEVTEAIPLDFYEVLRLRAAIIAASVQEMLVERIEPENALLAVEQIFPIIMQVLEEHKNEARGLAAMRHGDTPDQEAETDVDRALEPALIVCDRATKAFHLSADGTTGAERLDRLQQAKSGFKMALTLLIALDEQFKLTDEWRFWQQEVQKSLLVMDQQP